MSFLFVLQEILPQTPLDSLELLIDIIFFFFYLTLIFYVIVKMPHFWVPTLARLLKIPVILPTYNDILR